MPYWLAGHEPQYDKGHAYCFVFIFCVMSSETQPQLGIHKSCDAVWPEPRRL